VLLNGIHCAIFHWNFIRHSSCELHKLVSSCFRDSRGITAVMYKYLEERFNVAMGS
jgi:hypothetical protein